jgi:hypothetical protein
VANPQSRARALLFLALIALASVITISSIVAMVAKLILLP